MTRKDILVVGALAALLLAFLAPVWANGSPGFHNRGDLYAYHWPLRHHTAASLAEGRLPLWNPYILLGVPHAANPQAALFYPPSVLGFLLPAVAALTWDQILHLLWAGLGAFLLARWARLPRAAASVLAVAYALSPFLAYRVVAGIPTLVAALAWAPWAWLAWLGGSAFLLAAVFALQFFSGHPQFLVINACGMGLWAALRPGRARLLTRLGGAAAGALALAAAQWPATLALLRGSNRAGWPAEFAGSYSLEPRAAAMWLWPGLLGTPDAGWSGPASVFYESGGVWLGGILLAAALWRAASRRPALAAPALAVAGFLLALGANGPFAPLLSAPGFSYLRTSSRWSFLVLWGLWLLAGAALAELSKRRGLASLLPALPLVVFAELAVWDAGFLRHEDPRPFVAANAEVAARAAGRPLRVLTDPELANPNKTIVYRARNANGYEAFYPAGAARWAAEAEGAPAADSSRVLVSRRRSEAAARAGVALYLAPSGIEEDRAAWPLAAFIDRAGRRLVPDPALTVLRPESWRVAGAVPQGAAAVALAEQRWPGWRAALDGHDAALKPWGPAFSLVELPAGLAALDLSFDYRPSSPALWALSAAAWALWLLKAARPLVGAA